MTQSERPGTAPGFWACSMCGTPNPSASYLTHCVSCGAPRSAARPPGPAPAGPRPARARGVDPGRRARRARVALAALAGLYAAVVLAALAWLRLGLGPDWLLGPLLFMPRALFLAPAALLLPAALWLRARRAGGVVAATALVVAWPLMGFNVPWPRLLHQPPPGLTLRVMTFNRSHDAFDAEALIRLIERERVDLIAFQEIKPNPRLDAYFATGWYRNRLGSIASRLPMLEELPQPPDDSLDRGRFQGESSEVRLATHLDAEIVFGMAHLPTIRAGLRGLARGDAGPIELMMPYWERRLRNVHALVASGAGDRPYIWAGDFNMPPEHPAYEALPAPLRSAFAEAGWGWGYTRPARWGFARIDQILVSPEWTVRRCWVGPDLGSDHRPVLAEVVLPLPATPAP